MKRFLGSTAVLLALLLAVVSLVLSGLTAYGSLRARQAGLQALAEARAAFSALTDSTISASVSLSHTFPIQARVPLEQDFVVPIQTTIPISTVAQVPVEIPLLGTYRLSVPVQAEETDVSLETEVPVQLSARSLGLDGLFSRLDAALARAERGMRWPLAPAAAGEPE
jgi:hypothetical protein